MRVVFAVIAALAALAIIASACAGSDPRPTADSSTGPTPATVQAGSSDPLPFDAVLIELFGTADLDSYQADLDLEASEIVAECMRAAGFEFTLPESVVAEQGLTEPATLESAAADGFGLISRFRASIAGAGLGTGDINDVNRGYLQTLTAAELDRFFLTLQGEPAEPGQLPTKTGCQGEGNDRVFGAWARFNEALPQFGGMAEERDSDPDWLVARAEWRACMLEFGFDYAEPDAIRTDVAFRIENLILDGEDHIVVETEGGVILDPEIDALLDEMLVFEQDAAVANHVCNEPLQERFDAVEREVQQAFVERNQLTIDELFAAG